MDGIPAGKGQAPAPLRLLPFLPPAGPAFAAGPSVPPTWSAGACHLPQARPIMHIQVITRSGASAIDVNGRSLPAVMSKDLEER